MENVPEDQQEGYIEMASSWVQAQERPVGGQVQAFNALDACVGASCFVDGAACTPC